jgi:plasmid stabilization system protein ParE
MSRLPYRIQPLADRDLDDHVQYLRERDPAAALHFIDAAFDAFETLSENPLVG